MLGGTNRTKIVAILLIVLVAAAGWVWTQRGDDAEWMEAYREDATLSSEPSTIDTAATSSSKAGRTGSGSTASTAEAPPSGATSAPIDDRPKRGSEAATKLDSTAEARATPAPEEPLLLPPPELPEEAPTGVWGRLTRIPDREPLAGLVVVALFVGAADSGVEPIRTRSDELGRFVLPVDQSRQLVEIAVDSGPESAPYRYPTDVWLRHGKWKELNLEIPRGAQLTGRVVDEVGRPVRDATVEAWCRSSVALAEGGNVVPDHVVHTDVRGQFAIPAIGPQVVLHARDHKRLATNRIEGIVDNGQRYDGLELKLQPQTEWSGHVLGNGAEALVSARLRVRPLPADTARLARDRPLGEAPFWRLPAIATETYSGEQGQFAFRVPRAESYAIEVHHPEHPSYGVRVKELESGTKLRLGGGAQITGRVIDASGRPIAGAQVWLPGSPSRWTTTTETGSYGIFGLPNQSEQALLVLAEGFALEVREGLRWREGRPYRMDVSLKAQHLLAGRVVDDHGRAVFNTEVVLRGARKLQAPRFEGRSWEEVAEIDRVRTDGRGRFRFTGLSRGRYELEVASRRDSALRAEFTGVAGGPVLHLPLNAQTLRGVAFVGSVTNALTNEALSRFQIVPLRPTASGAASGEAQTFENPRGQFESTGLQPGAMRLRVQAQGFVPWTSPWQEFDLGDHVFQVRLWPERSLALRVEDRGGRIVEGAHLRFVDEDGDPLSVSTGEGFRVNRMQLGASGETEVHGLPATRVRVLVQLPDVVAPWEFDFDLSAEESPRQRLRLGFHEPQERIPLSLVFLEPRPGVDPRDLPESATMDWLEGVTFDERLAWPEGELQVTVRDDLGRVVARASCEPAATGAGFEWQATGKTGKQSPVAGVWLEVPRTRLEVELRADRYSTKKWWMDPAMAPPSGWDRVVYLRRVGN